MELPTEKQTVVKDGKCHVCRLELLSVKGGSNVIYIDDTDGTILKQEPYHRYKQRIVRRKGDKGYAIKV